MNAATKKTYNWTQRDNYIGLLVMGISFIFYLRTLCPTITWGDPAKLAVFSSDLLLKSWGAAHPLHNLTGHLWGLIPFKDYAFGQNLLSAIFASLTVGVISIITHKITRSIKFILI